MLRRCPGRDAVTLQEAIASQQTWVVIWTNVLLICSVGLPLALLIWEPSRVAGMVTALGTVVSGMAMNWLYGALGYVKLLGLPHIIVWGPVVWFLLGQVRRVDMPVWPKRIIWVIIAALSVSLVFDVVDVLRYLLGARTATILPAT